MDSSLIRRINFKQVKYIFPLIAYPFLLFIGYEVVKLTNFGSDTTEDPRLHTTQYLNSDLPEAAVDSTLGDKMDNVDNAFGHITDVSGVANVGSDRDSVNKKHDYESRYSDSEAQSVAQQDADRAALAEEKLREQERDKRLREMQERVRSRANRRSAGRVDSDDGFTDPVSDNAIAEEQRRRRQRQLDIINRNLAAASPSYRNGYNNGYGETGSQQSGSRVVDANGNPVAMNGSRSSYGNVSMVNPGSGAEGYGGGTPSGSYGNTAAGAHGYGGRNSAGYYSGTVGNAPTGIDGKEAVSVVKKGKDMSDYFNTIGGSRKKKSGLITAIIDENIKVVDGSRVRLRLLDDIVIGGETVKKGTYLYARMSGFSQQRVQGKVESIFVDDDFLRVSLTIYDTDGLEGLYVPESAFRESARDIASSVTEGGTDLTDNSYSGNGIRGWASNATRNVTQKMMNAFGKIVRKNKVRLKYGTRVYLVDGSQRERQDNRSRQSAQTAQPQGNAGQQYQPSGYPQGYQSGTFNTAGRNNAGSYSPYDY